MPSPQDDAALPRSFGVEEEFFLLDTDGEAASVAPDVLDSLAGDPRMHAEWMRYQVESASSVCTELPALGAELARMRAALAARASAHGALLVAVGTPPFDVPGAVALTEGVRYRRMVEEFDGITGAEATCACHVHVGVPTRDLGVAVLNRIRGWLPALLALSGNSPFWRGRDSGWASYRHVVLRAWPTVTLPPRCPDAATYDEILAACLVTGEAIDAASVYWLARLSPRYPTVEIRVPDTALTVRDAVLLAGLCRALVATALADVRAGRPEIHPPERLLAAAIATAACRGLDGLLVDPVSGRLVSGFAVGQRLLNHLEAALESAGDRLLVAELLGDRMRRGSGAARQRELQRSSDRPGFVAALARESLTGVSATVSPDIRP